MAQTFHGSLEDMGVNGPTLKTYLYDNWQAIATQWAGENPPDNPYSGQPWLDISEGWSNAVLKFWNGSSWIEATKNSTVNSDVELAKGSKNTLWERLEVSLNEDGTLKSSQAENLTEWVDSALTATYIAANQFSVEGDQTDIFVQNRKIKATLDASVVYSAIDSSSYDDTEDETTITLVDSVLNDTVQKIEYGLVKPGNTGGMPVIEQETPEIVGDVFNDFILEGITPTQSGRTIDTTSSYAYFNSEKIDVPAASTTFTTPTQYARHDVLSLDSEGNLVKTEGVEGQSVKAFRVEQDGFISRKYVDTPKELRNTVKVWNSDVTGDYATGWQLGTQEDNSGEYIMYTKNINARYYIGFTGTGLDIVVSEQSNSGIFGVKIDGGTETTYDNYREIQTFQVVKTIANNLPFGYHVAEIYPTGTKNANAINTLLYIDAFDIYTPDFSTSIPQGNQPVASMVSLPGAVTMSTIPSRPDFNEEKGWVRYEAEQYGEFSGSGWIADARPIYSGGKRFFTDTSDDYVEFAFIGDGIRFVTLYSDSHGIAEISIDGIVVTTVDTYNSVSWSQYVAYESTDLEFGEHVIKIRNTGSKNSSSSNYWIVIDAFEVYNPVFFFEDTRITTPLVKKQDKLQYILIQDQKPSGVSGGTFTAGAWRTRDLNAIVRDDTGEVVLENNRFVLPAGRYIINITAPVYSVNRNILQLWNLTQQYTITGIVNFSNSTSNVSNVALLNTAIKIDSNNTFEVLHRGETTQSVNGFGVDIKSVATTIFTTVEIIRIGDA